MPMMGRKARRRAALLFIAARQAATQGVTPMATQATTFLPTPATALPPTPAAPQANMQATIQATVQVAGNTTKSTPVVAENPNTCLKTSQETNEMNAMRVYTVSNTNLLNNPNPIAAKTALSTVGDCSEEMPKMNRARRWAALKAAKRVATQGFTPMATQATTFLPTPATALLPTPAAPQANMQATIQAAVQVATNTTKYTPVVAVNPNTWLKTGQETNEMHAMRVYNNQQRKKWLKFQKQNKINSKWVGRKSKNINPAVIPEDPPMPEMSQDGSPSIITEASEPQPGVSTFGVNQGSTVPMIQKPNITLNTKKNLQQQQETTMQRFTCIKPAANVPANVPANVTGTSATPQDSPQVVESPASTIPILENRTADKTKKQPRSSAGSFFQKQSPVQQPTQQKAAFKVSPFTYVYPKGVPRSFLLQQEKSLEPGGAPITADSPIWPNNPNPNAYMNVPSLGPHVYSGDNIKTPRHTTPDATPPVIVPQTEAPVDVQQPYSPSDIYSEQGANPEPPELEMESSDQNQSTQKRLSAFQRLGPVSQPKKPKLTINLNLKKEQPVREVVNETEDDPDKYTPVHLRQDILSSTDETVVKYLPLWPWRKNVAVSRSATARTSRSVMILEQEKMEEAYEKDNIIQITVKGYPSTWTKERVLDAILVSVKGYSLIPCFIEFQQNECKFFVVRCRSALIVLHKTGFYIHKDGVELSITISIPVLADELHFIPRIILRRRMVMATEDNKLNLSAFSMQDDISHFIYFPLNRLSNQAECIRMQADSDWEKLVELNLSHNRLTTLSGFDLVHHTPNLKHLDLSHNYLEKINVLLNDRDLPIKKIFLEGNPMCHDYTDPDHYVKVIRMMFPAIVEIDGVPIRRKDKLPDSKQNYCPEDAQEVSEKFLEIFFPLLDSGSEHRSLIQGMYDEDASLTITYCYKLRYGKTYRNFRNLFLYARFLDEGETDSVVGAMAITKLINRWPHTEHDPFTFTVDALYHSEHTTILRIGGVLKLTAETLADEECLLSFTRTIVLHSEDGVEYKILNEMVYWDEPTASAARAAFRVNTISQKNFNLKIEATTDEDLRDKYLKIFMKLTTVDKKICERCLEVNNWNFKLALEHFTKLLKLNNLDSLTQEIPVTTTS